jgi:hypothetical protein
MADTEVPPASAILRVETTFPMEWTGNDQTAFARTSRYV